MRALRGRPDPTKRRLCPVKDHMESQGRIPFVLWGGEPIKTLRQTRGFVWARDCMELARALAVPRAEGDRGYMGQLQAGRVWIDVPAGDFGAGERLMVRSFYLVSEGGQRNLWFHGAFRIPPGPASAETHAGFLGRIGELTIDSLMGAEMESGIPAVCSERVVRSATEWPRVMTGSWSDVVKSLEFLVLRTEPRLMGQVRIGCNLPERYEGFTTFVESEGYSAPEPPKADSRPGRVAGQAPRRTSSRRRGVLGLVALVASYALSGTIGFVVGGDANARGRPAASLSRENEALIQQIRTLEEENRKLRGEIEALRQRSSGGPGRAGPRKPKGNGVEADMEVDGARGTAGDGK